MGTGRQKKESIKIMAEIDKMVDEINEESAGISLYIVTDRINASINNKKIVAVRGDRVKLTEYQARVLKYVTLKLNKDEK